MNNKPHQHEIHPKQDAINIIVLYIVGFAFAFWVMSLTACSEQKKNDRAISRVLGSYENMQKVEPEIRKRFPCANDTTFNSDTTIHIDSTYNLIWSKDTINNHDTITITVTKVVTKTIHDTAIVLDKAALKDATDSITSLRLQVANLKGQLLQEQQNVTTVNSTAKFWQKAAWITWILLVIGVCLGIYFKRKI